MRSVKDAVRGGSSQSFRYAVAMQAGFLDKSTERVLRSAVLGDVVPVAASHGVSPHLARVPAPGIFPALERALRRLRRQQRRTPSENGLMWVHAVSVGEVNASAPLVNALLADASRPAHPRHDDHADRFGARARVVGRCGVACVPAVRPAGRGVAFPAAFPAPARVDHGNGAVAEPAARMSRPRRGDVHRQCAPVGALAARLSRAQAADRPRIAHACAACSRNRPTTPIASVAWAHRQPRRMSPAT